MDRYRPAAGTPVSDLDTPCLVLDLDVLEANYGVIAKAYGGPGPKMRQHAKNLKAPVLARMQMDAGGTVGGVCVAKVSEAEVMVEGGINDVLITSQVASRDKLRRLCALARRATIGVAVDDTWHVREVSRAADEAGVRVGVIIEVDTQMGRAGVRAAENAVAIARMASDLPGVVFRGVMSHQTIPGQPDRETRLTEGTRFIGRILEIKAAIEAAGIPVDVVSTGETWTYDVATKVRGITEVQGGTYALMSTSYGYMEDFAIAAKVLSTVVSRPDEHTAIGDAGLHCLAGPGGLLPSVDGLADVSVTALGPTHCVLTSAGTMPLQVGDQCMLLTAQQDIMLNRWDQYIAVRNGLVEAVWDIPARGCHH
jgi:3-hydroxy-D-aspartate aldolase